MAHKEFFEINLGNIAIRIITKTVRVGGNKTDSVTHSHTSYELHCLLSGEASMEFDGGCTRLYEGETAIVHPELFHRFSQESEGAVIISLSFYLERRCEGEDYYSLISDALLSEASQATRPIVLKRIGSLEECIRRIAAEFYSDNIFSSEILRANFIILFSEIFSQLSNGTRLRERVSYGKEEYNLRTFLIEDYFNRYYVEKVKLSDLATFLSLSEKQTERAVKQSFGVGFREHLLRLRIKSACELLTGTDTEIKRIAETVGYGSYNGFHKIFTSRLGISPEEYRKREKKA